MRRRVRISASCSLRICSPLRSPRAHTPNHCHRTWTAAPLPPCPSHFRPPSAQSQRFTSQPLTMGPCPQTPRPRWQRILVAAQVGASRTSRRCRRPARAAAAPETPPQCVRQAFPRAHQPLHALPRGPPRAQPAPRPAGTTPAAPCTSRRGRTCCHAHLRRMTRAPPAGRRPPAARRIRSAAHSGKHGQTHESRLRGCPARPRAAPLRPSTPDPRSSGRPATRRRCGGRRGSTRSCSRAAWRACRRCR